MPLFRIFPEKLLVLIKMERNLIKLVVIGIEFDAKKIF